MWPELQSDAANRSSCRRVITEGRRSIGFYLSALILLLFALGPMAMAQQELVNEIQLHGNRRIPAETIRARMFTKAGDVYDQQNLERDFNSLWNTGYFEDLRFEREQSPKGWIIHVYVKEKPTIREIKYLGLNSVSQSDVLDRFKERKVGLTQESQYDPTKVKHAEVVIKELLGEHGRQFAEIKTEVRQIPPAAVSVTFNVKEGPKVKVGKITFEGNKNMKSRELRAAMKNLKPYGIPHSIFLENLFAKTYDATKLNEDAERVRDEYQQNGYFKALVQDPKTKIRDTSSIKWYFPIKTSKGKAVDITMPIEEGEKYRLKQIKFTGYKAINNVALLRRLIPMKDGDIFNVEMMRKGLKNLRDAYGEYGYINFTPVPNTEIDDEKREITVTFDLDEGAQFYVRRIEFKGNTTTRDKVIRRELALEEGGIYNKKLWDLSLLRLNQLGYFDTLKTEDQAQGGEGDTETKIDNQNHTVDLLLKVKEKGKNSIGLSGGVSGLSGSFIGINYETNNFLGLGETLTVQASVGDIQRNIMFGFTEPYLFDRPLQFGFTVFTSKYNFNQLEQNQLLTGQKITLPDSILQSLQNFSQSTTGFTVSASYPLKRSFKRIGLTYSLDRSSINVFSDFSRLYFEELNFRNVSGPNALQGVLTSKVIPSLTFNTIDNPMRPHSGHSFYIASEIAGLGGDVSDIRPIMEWKQFIPMKGLHPKLKDPYAGHQAFGYRIQASFLSGYGGKVAPPFNRFYMGGDTDIRGFDIRAVSPVAYFVEAVNGQYINPDDPCVTAGAATCTGIPKNPNNPRQGAWTVPVPVYRLIFPGGDTNIIGNFEYRIPIAGPVTLAPFTDIGFNGILRPSQLQVNDQQFQTLTTGNFGCPALDSNFNCIGQVPGSSLNVSRELKIVGASNWVPRMSTGLELQVIMPIVNAPFRIYYAYNPLRMNTISNTPFQITRSMFPNTSAGDFSYAQALANYGSGWLLREPRKTFRFTVSTTF
ncbi:MAG TPA: outer membrane protein assembly factor BamA [Terriglobales bacterium]|nr:outer membrane protein assembly factor BamA [Terriglobales bacterium]